MSAAKTAAKRTKLNAMQRYNLQPEDNATMQEPIYTRNGLYVWEQWTCKGDKITDIRYYAEDINGGNTMRISKEDFIYHTTKRQ